MTNTPKFKKAFKEKLLNLIDSEAYGVACGAVREDDRLCLIGYMCEVIDPTKWYKDKNFIYKWDRFEHSGNYIFNEEDIDKIFIKKTYDPSETMRTFYHFNDAYIGVNSSMSERRKQLHKIVEDNF